MKTWFRVRVAGLSAFSQLRNLANMSLLILGTFACAEDQRMRLRIASLRLNPTGQSSNPKDEYPFGY